MQARCHLIAVAVASALTVAAQQRGALPSAPQELNLPPGGVRVPIERHHGMTLVPVTINGHGPYKFVVDTGAPGIVIHDQVAAGMELDDGPMGGMQVRVAGPGGDGIPATIHRIGSLRIGDAELKGLTALALELPFSKDHAGVIGMGVFQNCLMTFDYPGGAFLLRHGELPAADGEEILAYTMPRQANSHPVIPVNFCGETVDFTLDTGMSGWIRFPQIAEERCGFAHGPVAGPRARSVDREFDLQLARLDGTLSFGAFTFDRPHGALAAEDGFFPLLGSQILEHFALTIDQHNKRLRFARADRSAITPPAYRTPGFGLKPDAEDRLVVWGLRPDTPAHAAGLREGDIVTRVAGQPAAAFWGSDESERLVHSGRELAITWRSAADGTEHEATIATQELIPAVR